MFLVAVLVQPHAYLMWQNYLIDKSQQAPIVRRAREIEVAREMMYLNVSLANEFSDLLKLWVVTRILGAMSPPSNLRLESRHGYEFQMS